jgi:hypothetical protein
MGKRKGGRAVKAGNGLDSDQPNFRGDRGRRRHHTICVQKIILYVKDFPPPRGAVKLGTKTAMMHMYDA